jgi:hypothetical protein
LVLPLVSAAQQVPWLAAVHVPAPELPELDPLLLPLELPLLDPLPLLPLLDPLFEPEPLETPLLLPDELPELLALLPLLLVLLLPRSPVSSGPPLAQPTAYAESGMATSSSP